MAALPELELGAVYDAARRKARIAVGARYSLVHWPPERLGAPEHWLVEVTVAGKPLGLIMVVPATFPDRLPKVYLAVDCDIEPGRVPHLGKDKLVCTFDESSALPNPDLPGDVALAVVERAQDLLSRGLAGINRADVADELAAYWPDDGASVYSSVRLEAPHRDVCRLEAEGPRGLVTVVSEDEAEGRTLLRSLTTEEPSSVGQVPYLHLETLKSGDLPRTNGEVVSWCAATAGAKDTLVTGYGRQRPSALAVASVPVGAGRAVVAWKHERLQGSVPGFRAGHVPPLIELERDGKNMPVSRVAVNQLDAPRLQARAVGTPIPGFAAGVIGCGALGGLAADHLARAGATSLRLFDPDMMGVENSLRHVCGLADVGRCKVDAVADHVRSHATQIEVATTCRDVLEVMLGDGAQVLGSPDLTIVAIGNTTVERRLNGLAVNGALGKAVAFIWVEPHGLAGHAILVRPGMPGCFECCLDPRFRFIRRVVANPEALERREVGCQSTYLPYGWMAASGFMAVAMARALAWRAGDTGPLQMTWVGDLAGAANLGVELEEEWRDAAQFSTHERAMEPRADCPVCSRNR